MFEKKHIMSYNRDVNIKRCACSDFLQPVGWYISIGSSNREKYVGKEAKVNIVSLNFSLSLSLSLSLSPVPSSGSFLEEGGYYKKKSFFEEGGYYKKQSYMSLTQSIKAKHRPSWYSSSSCSKTLFGKKQIMTYNRDVNVKRCACSDPSCNQWLK